MANGWLSSLEPGTFCSWGEREASGTSVSPLTPFHSFCRGAPIHVGFGEGGEGSPAWC